MSRKTILAQRAGTIRRTAATIIANPGWAGRIDDYLAVFRRKLIANDPGNPGWRAEVGQIIAELGRLLRAVAAAPPGVLLTEYLDLLPLSQANALAEAGLAVLREAGCEVTRLCDADGRPFLQISGLEKLGVPRDELDRLTAGMTSPVGGLHRIQ
jgi:hypothetical protein